MVGIDSYNQPGNVDLSNSVNPIAMPNFTQNAVQGMTLRDLRLQNDILQNQATKSDAETGDLMAQREAIENNTTQDPTTGQLNVDYKGTLKDMVDGGHALAALNFQQAQQERVATIQEKQASLQATQLANQSGQINLAGQVLQHIQSSPDPQKALDNLNTVVQQNPQMYASIAHVIPKDYDPDTFGQFVNQAEKTSDFINQKIEVNRLGLTATKQNADILQTANSAVNEVAGQYKDDPNTKNYVEIANTYTSNKAMLATKPDEVAQGLFDRGLIYNYANIENPGRSATGSVAEQDIDAKSYLDKIGVHLNGPLDGSVLSASQRTQLQDFIENKYQQETLKQQAVFNQYQNRLVHMAAQGQPIDAYHALPTYGDVVQNVPKTAVDHSEDLHPGAEGIQIDGTAPPLQASDLYKPATKSSIPTPPPATAFKNSTAKVVSLSSIDQASVDAKQPVETLKAHFRSLGYKIEGE